MKKAIRIPDVGCGNMCASWEDVEVLSLCTEPKGGLPVTSNREQAVGIIRERSLAVAVHVASLDHVLERTGRRNELALIS